MTTVSMHLMTAFDGDPPAEMDIDDVESDVPSIRIREGLGRVVLTLSAADFTRLSELSAQAAKIIREAP